MHTQIHEKIANIITENLPRVDISEWLESAMPRIISGGPKEFAETTNARIQDLTKMLDDWEPLDMWKGVVSRALLELLEGLGIKKRNRAKAAQEIVSTLEKAATDLWILTNAEKQKKGKIEAPQRSQQVAVARLQTVDKLHYSLQEFSDLHPAHQTNTIMGKTQMATR